MKSNGSHVQPELTFKSAFRVLTPVNGQNNNFIRRCVNWCHNLFEVVRNKNAEMRVIKLCLLTWRKENAKNIFRLNVLLFKINRVTEDKLESDFEVRFDKPAWTLVTRVHLHIRRHRSNGLDFVQTNRHKKFVLHIVGAQSRTVNLNFCQFLVIVTSTQIWIFSFR